MGGAGASQQGVRAFSTSALGPPTRFRSSALVTEGGGDRRWGKVLNRQGTGDWQGLLSAAGWPGPVHGRSRLAGTESPIRTSCARGLRAARPPRGGDRTCLPVPALAVTRRDRPSVHPEKGSRRGQSAKATNELAGAGSEGGSRHFTSLALGLPFSIEQTYTECRASAESLSLQEHHLAPCMSPRTNP